MARRTVFLPDSVDALVRDNMEAGESFSAAVTRLLRMGARMAGHKHVPPYVGIGHGGPPDLGINAEKYLRQLIEEHEDRR
ncbi:MAG: hypothetical protein WD826_00585 [Actinomycetota bacterium]